MYRSLFIDGAQEIIKNNNLKYSQNKLSDISTHKFSLAAEQQKLFKNPPGDYYTINYTAKALYQNSKSISNKLQKAIKSLFKQHKYFGTTLIIGLGNSSIIGDSLGPKTINKLIATNHYDNFITIPKVALFAPEVIGKTGISSYNLIKMLVKDLKPSTIIFIDSLSTNNKNNLNYTIEITDTGIIPGSAININKEITRATFNIPIIAIGVPLFLENEKELYTSLNIKEIVEETSRVIAYALNNYFFH